MQQSKYFYKGIPISVYCNKHNINKKTVRSRISKKKNDPKYSNYTEQEIVDMVIESYGSSIKYEFDGMSLRQYCLKNEINYDTITSRIEKIKKENPNYSSNELVNAALVDFVNTNYRFFYDGMPLKDYCEQNPEINYHTIRSFINVTLEGNPNLSIQDAIELYLLKEHKGRYKWYYCGMPLVEYCKENNMKYDNVLAYMKRHKKETFDKELTDDEYIEIIMNQYESFELKYIYNGVSLRQYCIQNSLSYDGIVTFVRRKLQKNPNLNIDDLIKEGINSVKKYGIIYYYNGIPLKDYCKEKGYNIHSIRSSIIKNRRKNLGSLQEIVNQCVENYKVFTTKYFYSGSPLFTFCKKNGLSYTTVLNAYDKKIAENNNMTTDAVIKEIIDYYIKNPPVRTKYYITDDKSQSLRNFCNENGYSYEAIWLRMKLLEQKGLYEEKKQCMMEAILKYERKLEIQNINLLFEELQQGKFTKLENQQEICEKLKINGSNVLDLIEMDFSLNQAINIIWYFSDKTDEKNYKTISDKKLNEVFTIVEQVKIATDEELKKFELYDLIGIYKSELYDTRTAMLIRQQNYLKSVIKKICFEYNVPLTRTNFLEFESEVKLYFIAMINRSHLNHIGQIIKYMDLTVKGYFRMYLKKYKINMNCISLDSPQFNIEKENKNAKSKLDYIKGDFNVIENKGGFSKRMMAILKTLSEDDLNFIILKFQEEYSNQELAQYFHISIDEVKEKEFSILSMLKDNENIKSLKKIRKDID